MSNLKSFVVGTHFEGLDSGYLMRSFGGNNEYPGEIPTVSPVTYRLYPHTVTSCRLRHEGD